MGNACSTCSVVAPELTKKDIRIALIGKSGCGKSATGNSILMKKVFESKAGTSPVTKKCIRDDSEFISGLTKYKFTVVDTPGFNNSDMEEESVTEVIRKCIEETKPGPNVILLVISLVERFTEDEERGVLHLLTLFGEELKKFLIIVFTHGDEIKGIEAIDDKQQIVPTRLKDLPNNKFIFFNNSLNSKRQMTAQLTSLISVVTEMIDGNDQKNYSAAMFQHAQEELQKQLKQQEEMLQAELEKKYGVKEKNNPGFFQKVTNGLYGLGKDYIEAGVRATGLPRFVNGVSDMLGFKSSE